MRKRLLAIAAVGLMATATMTACDDSGESGEASSGGGYSGSGETKARVGVILPDTKSSDRWRDEDPKYLKAAFDSQNVPVEIVNADGNRAKFVQIAESMLENGVKVLIIANLDSESGKEVLAKAREKKIPTIDYDRLTLNGNANYYVSFNNEKVGALQAYGLQKCLQAKKIDNPIIAQLNGSPSDNNATLFKQGYEGVLKDMYGKARFTMGPAQWVPDWEPEQAEKIFEQMLTQSPRIGGVLAANDGIGNAVIKVLRKYKRNGAVPVTGQDATLEGVQNILTGEQCMTVYKAVKQEADNAARVAIQLFKGENPTANDTIKDPESGGYVPFISLDPKPITLANVNDVVVADKFIDEAELCKGKYLNLCKQHGVGRYAKDNSDDDNA